MPECFSLSIADSISFCQAEVEFVGSYVCYAVCLCASIQLKFYNTQYVHLGSKFSRTLKS